MFWILVTGLWAAMLLSPFVLLYIFLPTGRECPRCSGETLPIRSRVLRPFRALATQRWCLGCGWEGLTRSAVVRRPTPRLKFVPDHHVDPQDEEPWRQSL